ncbi:MAG: hypothetical protein ACOX3Q_13175 [Clostridia bacterium]|jgi:hypothetical protein|nr:hypothetical protein [Clostridiaceae bacterium]
MADTDRRCPYCHAAVKQRAFRCAACGSLIGRKNKNIPSIEPEPREDAEPSNCLETEEVLPKRRALSTTGAGLFLFGLMVFIPLVGQLAGLITGLVLFLQGKSKDGKYKGRVYIFQYFLFFVFWFAVLYFLNEYFGLVKF